MKRAFDLILTILSAPLWVPLALVVALLVRVKLGRPVLFVQERAGRACRPFRLVKFRTMRDGEGTDAERLTPFGSFLRSASLDELPELWNVLRGEMSLVGPRPLPTRYLPRYTAEQNRRHEVLPGITGWAQVNGRNTLDWETKFRYDVEYVDRRSLAMDLGILFRTVAQVVVRKDIAHAGEATMSEFTGSRRLCGAILAAAFLCAGCLSQLTVSSGGASSPGHCNKRECALGSLYGIDWSGKKNGVESQEPAYPMCRVTTSVRPLDFAIGFFTLGLVVPLQLEYDFETQPLPRKVRK